mmetsp:Transcript_29963/g.74311  ORF Transcript_29963/g.74311 Transcript_29963/m.74311 type:complete len:118 (+) Transcript_29963:689-1042(+)
MSFIYIGGLPPGYLILILFSIQKHHHHQHKFASHPRHIANIRIIASIRDAMNICGDSTEMALWGEDNRLTPITATPLITPNWRITLTFSTLTRITLKSTLTAITLSTPSLLSTLVLT